MRKLSVLLAIVALFMIPETEVFSQAIRFGAGKGLQTPTNVTTLTDNVTMECWVRWNGTSAIGTLIYNGNGSFNGYGIYMDGSAQIHFLAGGTSDAMTGYFMTANTWTHLAIRRAAGTWRLIVNGVQQGWSSAVAPGVPGSPGFLIGTSFPGDIDEARVWNTPVSNANILANYQQSVTSSHPDYANLAAYYPMNEGTGQTTADVHGGNTMTFGATTAVAADDPTWINEPSPISVPTLGEWAMIIFSIGMVGLAWYYMRQRRTALA